MELSTLFGLPAHPLIVHSVVVLVPLVAFGALAVAFSARLRARYLSLVAAGAALNVLLVPLASGSGEELQARVSDTALVQAHARLAEQLLPIVIVLAIAVVFLAVRPWLVARRGAAAPWAKQGLASAMVALSVLGATASLVQVARIGHSGAKAAWTNVNAQSSR